MDERNDLEIKDDVEKDGPRNSFTSGKEAKHNHTQNEEVIIVSWDGPDDPAKPVNWPTWRRWTIISLVTAVTFCSGLSSSIFAPGVPQLMAEFHSDNSVLGTLVVSIFVLGLATGPIFFAPLSELYGRLPIQHIGNVGFMCFTIGCGLATSLSMLIGFRLMQGTFAAVSYTNGGGVIADMVKQEERGFALTMFTIGILSAPVLGPVIGGFLTLKGWRWSFWICAILLSLPFVLCILLYRESYPPILLERKAAKLRRQTGNLAYRSEYDRGESSVDHFKRGIGRAVKMLIFSPIVLALSIYMGLVYSYFYLLLTTLTTVFLDVYHFKTTIVGLAYLGLGFGYLFGQFVFAQLSDRIIKWKSAKNEDGEMKPEYRLPLAVAGGASVPIAFFWYGWSVQARVHWIMPIIGPFFLGLGNSLIFMSIQAYSIDAFTIYAASALAANTITRSIMAAVLPLAAPKMYETLGYGWGNSLLAFLAIAMIPVPYYLMKHGEKMRMTNADRMKSF